MSFRYEVKVHGKWYPNKVYFATEAEADRAGHSKFFSWTMCEGYQVVEDTAPVNYQCDADGRVIYIGPATMEIVLQS